MNDHDTYIRVVSPEGIEALVTERAFAEVWKARGFTLPKPKKTTPKKTAKKTTSE